MVKLTIFSNKVDHTCAMIYTLHQVVENNPGGADHGPSSDLTRYMVSHMVQMTRVERPFSEVS